MFPLMWRVSDEYTFIKERTRALAFVRIIFSGSVRNSSTCLQHRMGFAGSHNSKSNEANTRQGQNQGFTQ